jgi:hypothetical protein
VVGGEYTNEAESGIIEGVSEGTIVEEFHRKIT